MQAAEAFGMYPVDLAQRPGSLYWISAWRDIKRAEADALKQRMQEKQSRSNKWATDD